MRNRPVAGDAGERESRHVDQPGLLPGTDTRHTRYHHNPQYRQPIAERVEGVVRYHPAPG